MNESQQFIMCVDDDPMHLAQLREHLWGNASSHEIALLSSMASAIELTEKIANDGRSIALAITSQGSVGIRGVQVLEEVKRHHPDAAKVLVVEEKQADTVAAAIRQELVDRYFVKPWSPADFRLTVSCLLSKHRLAQQNVQLVQELREKNNELLLLNRDLEMRVAQRTAELAEANARLSQLAVTDGLTGKYNHRYFQERLYLEVERCNRNKLPLSILMVDVDHFKQYNDLHGHPAGDAILRQVASALSEGRRANDIVARYGGEEFSVLLIDTPRHAAAVVAEQIRDQIASRRMANAYLPSGRVTVSIGVASCPIDGVLANDLLVAADNALYQAKHKGRNRVELAAPMIRRVQV